MVGGTMTRPLTEDERETMRRDHLKGYATPA